MKHIKHFIWDFDGTLADTYPNLVRYMQLSLADFGRSAVPTEILEKMMESIGYAVNYYAEKFQISDLSNRYDHYYSLGKDDPAYAFEGVEAVLKHIQQSGGANYIYTNRGESIIKMLNEIGLHQYFVEIVKKGDEAFRFKPAPDSILYLMEKYGGTCDDTVMIGDRKRDLESGYLAGCKTLHLLTPSVPQSPPCDWRIENYRQMLQMLQ